MYQATYNNKKYNISIDKSFYGHGTGYCVELDKEVSFRINKDCPNQINVFQCYFVDKSTRIMKYNKILFHKLPM